MATIYQYIENIDTSRNFISIQQILIYHLDIIESCDILIRLIVGKPIEYIIIIYFSNSNKYNYELFGILYIYSYYTPAHEISVSSRAHRRRYRTLFPPLCAAEGRWMNGGDAQNRTRFGRIAVLISRGPGV